MPGLESAEYMNELTYIRDIGAKHSTVRTEEQVTIARFWLDGAGTFTPPGHWNAIAAELARQRGQSWSDNLRLFALLNLALGDANIIDADQKYTFHRWRPITAIRWVKEGKLVLAFGGPERPTEPIPGETWMPYNPGSNLTPAFPSYFSGHSTFSRASAEVLKLFTGSDAFGFSTVIPANFGRVEPGIPEVPTTISFATLSGAAEQAGMSRLYGGIHFSDDNTVGQAVGAQIGRLAWTRASAYFNGTP